MFLKTPAFRQGGEDDRVTENFWEIDVPRNFDMCWSIVLSVLKNSEDSNCVALLKKLTGNDVGNAVELRLYVRRYNPFWNRHACFFDERLKALVTAFDKHIANYMHSPEWYKYVFEYFNSLVNLPNSMELKLEAISLMLNCRITLISEPVLADGDGASIADDAGDGDEDSSAIPHIDLSESNVSVYPLYASATNENWDSKVTLYHKRSCKGSQGHVTFGLPEDMGLNLQKNAFRRILGMAEITDGVSKLFSLPQIRERFMITLLKNNSEDVLQKILDHPVHVLDKLQQAGFDVSPTEKGSSMLPDTQIYPTAFYYAMQGGHERLLYSMYSYSTNATSMLDSSTRNPDVGLICHLIHLNGVLSETLQIAALQSRKDDVRRMMELSKFHQFQLQVCQKILNIQQKSNFGGLTPDKVHEAECKKDVVIAILDDYRDNFYMGESPPSDQWGFLFEPYDLYLKYVRFFRTLDFQAALLFFDRSFSLKSHLKLHGNGYEVTESAFLRLIFLWRYYYSNLRNAISREAVPFLSFECDLLLGMMSHLERVKYHDQLDKFIPILSSTAVIEDKKTSLSGPEIYTLQTQPEIRDHFVVLRLRHYTTLAVEADLDKEFDQSVLIILRALQVIGESVKMERETGNPTIIKALLVSSLPEWVSKDLFKCRDMLSHQKTKQIHARVNIEQDKPFIMNIQNELKNICYSMKHIFDFQSMLLRLHVLKSGMNVINDWRNSLTRPSGRESKTNENGTEKDSGIILDRLDRLLSLESFPTHEKKNQDDDSPESSSSSLSVASTPIRKIRKTHLSRYFQILLPHLKKTRELLQKTLQTHRIVYEDHFGNIFSRIQMLIELPDSKECREKITYLLALVRRLFDFIIVEMGYRKASTKQLLRTLGNFGDPLDIEDEDGFLTESKTLLGKYENFQCEVFEKLDDASVCVLIPGVFSNFDHQASQISRLKYILRGKHFCSKESKEMILLSVPLEYKEHHEAKTRLVDSLKTGNILSDENKQKEYAKLKLSSKRLKTLKKNYEKKNVDDLEKTVDYYDVLEKGLETNELKRRDFDDMCRKFRLTKEVSDELSNIVLDNPIEDEALEFFYSRVLKMKEMIIRPDHFINYLWENAKSQKTKAYIHDRLVRIYLKRPSLQAAVEMLLFDCMSLMKGKQGFKYLWSKTDYLFSGMNLRNVFAHGNPLFEAVGMILDPCDLPNEIIAKVLELLDDIESLEAMCELRKKAKADLIQLVSSDTDDEYNDLRAKVRKCEKWKEYASLVPKCTAAAAASASRSEPAA